AKERARRSVVCPDLILVLERRRAQPWRRKHRRHPAALVLDARLRRVVKTRHADGEEALERLLLREAIGQRRGQVGVVEPCPVRQSTKSFTPAARTSGFPASTATAGSFWWFRGVKPLGLPLVTRELAPAAAGKASTPAVIAQTTSRFMRTLPSVSFAPRCA